MLLYKRISTGSEGVINREKTISLRGTGTIPTGATSSTADMPDETSSMGLFQKYLVNKNIFKNREVLRHSSRPNILPHRQPEINTIASILAASLKGETPSNILIYGKTGTGKTACVRYVAAEAREGEPGDRDPLPCHPPQLRGHRHPVPGYLRRSRRASRITMNARATGRAATSPSPAGPRTRSTWS